MSCCSYDSAAVNSSLTFASIERGVLEAGEGLSFLMPCIHKARCRADNGAYAFMCTEQNGLTLTGVL